MSHLGPWHIPRDTLWAFSAWWSGLRWRKACCFHHQNLLVDLAWPTIHHVSMSHDPGMARLDRTAGSSIQTCPSTLNKHSDLDHGVQGNPAAYKSKSGMGAKPSSHFSNTVVPSGLTHLLTMSWVNHMSGLSVLKFLSKKSAALLSFSWCSNTSEWHCEDMRPIVS